MKKMIKSNSSSKQGETGMGMMKKRTTALVLTVSLVAAALGGCGQGQSTQQEVEYELNAEVKGATEQTVERNNGVYALLDFDDEQEKEFACGVG